jgi:hypothetical protein
VFGLICGAAGAVATICVLAVVHVLGGSGSEPGTVSGSCDGGRYAVTLAMGPGANSAEVTAQVLISDAKARVWQVRWHGWEDQLPIFKTKSASENSEDVAHVFQPLGDLDDGTDRLVWLRPEGVENWCKITAHLK